MTHTVLYDPDGWNEAELPLDREPFETLVKAVLASTDPSDPLQPLDYEEVALQLAGHARVVADDVQRRASTLPTGNVQRVLAEVILRETERRLSTPSQDMVRCCQNRARLVDALYNRLDVEGLTDEMLLRVNARRAENPYGVGREPCRAG